MRLSRPARIVAFLCLAVFPAWCGDDAGQASAGGGSGTPAPTRYAYDSPWEKDPSDWYIAIYPIYAWVPVFGARANFPDIGGPGGGGGSILDGSVSGSFNGAFFSGIEIQKSRVTGHAEFLYASVSGDNSNPLVHIGLKAVYGGGSIGYEIVDHLSLEGGVRRLAVQVDADVNNRPGITVKPGLWDPLIGMTWKHQIGRKWMLTAHADGGGFGVGSDVDVGASARADWRFAKHFGATMGFGALHFQFTRSFLEQTQLGRTLKFRQTLFGPLFGFGIYF